MPGSTDEEIVTTFQRIEITANGVDWEREGLLGQSSTWTHLVADTPFTTGLLAAMAGRPSLWILVAWMYWPLWIVWGFLRKWRMMMMKREHVAGKRRDQRG